jgi:2-amino-4-hydroxy-6-hydroxymethyldihydropteridine diphosphokinase
MAASAPIVVLLGSNIAPEQGIVVGFRRLRERFAVVRASRVYETEPVATRTRSPKFLNAAVEIAAELGPEAIKYEVLRDIESSMGRVRVPGDKSAPRIIDLDLVIYGDRVMESPLTLPDPTLLTCAYSAVPVAEIVPDYVHPVARKPMSEIAKSLGKAGILVRQDIRLDA